LANATWLQRRVRKKCFEALAQCKLANAEENELRQLNEFELLSIVLHWMYRFVPVRPRQVYLSKEIEAYVANGSDASQLFNLISEIERGDDLTARLSKKARVPYIAKAGAKNWPFQNRADLDLLLFEWDIHHLHIGARQRDGTVKRSKSIVFIRFYCDEAYMFFVRGHGCTTKVHPWASADFLKTALENWPSRNMFLKLVDVLPGPNSTDSERNVLRNHGYSSILAQKDGVYIGTNMISTAGTSLKLQTKASRILKRLYQFEQKKEANDAVIRGRIATNKQAITQKIRYDFWLTFEEWGICEVYTKCSMLRDFWR
jgi:hypothetical protein